MPRYYFDIDDGGERFEDASGIDLPDQDAVRREAFTLLRDAVHRLMPEGRHVLTVTVRDEAGRLVYQGEMSVDGRRSLP